MSKNLVRIGVAVLTTVLALIVLWQFRIVVAYVLISLMLAASIRPLFQRLAGRRFIVRLVWILIYIIVVAGFGYILFLTIGASASELQNMVRSVAAQDKWTLLLWSGSSFQQVLLERLPSPSVLLQNITGPEGELVIPVLLGIAQGIGGIVTAIAVIFVLSIYWGINQIHFERLWLSLLPSDQRKRVRDIWRTIEPDIGSYIRVQFVQGLLVGLLLGLGYWLLGSPYPTLLALIGAVVCTIPVVGLILVVIPPLLVGLLTSVQLGLLTGLYTILVLIAIILWVKPRLISRRWDNPILTVVLLIALADAFGLIGIIVAPPISVVCQILWSRLVSHRSVDGAASQISDLAERLAHVKELVNAMEEPHPPLVTSSLERISNLIVAAEPVLAASFPSDPSEPVLPSQQKDNHANTPTDCEKNQ
jgi:predicted PurR-regulated permease PerM